MRFRIAFFTAASLVTTVPMVAQDRSTEAIHRHLHDELVDAVVAAVTSGEPSTSSEVGRAVSMLDIQDARLNGPILALLKSDEHASAAVSWFPRTTLSAVEKLPEVLAAHDRLLALQSSGDGVGTASNVRRAISTLEKAAFKIVSEASAVGDLELVDFIGEKLNRDDVSTFIIKLTGALDDDRATFLPRMVELAKQAETVEAQYEAIGTAAYLLNADLISHAKRVQQMQMFAERVKQLAERVADDRGQVEGQIDNKLPGYAKRIIDRFDKNGDRLLEPGEMEEMEMSLRPKDADTDRDGKISVEEYARYLQQRRR